MEKLKVTDRGQLKKIEYTEKISNGIFLVTENKVVKNNCKVLEIDLGENEHEYELKQKVTKLGKTGIVTTRIKNEYFQYIFRDYADPKDVDTLIHETPRETKELLRHAFNLTKMQNIQDLNFLGGILDNRN